MKPQRFINSLLAGSAVAALAVAGASAASFSVPAGDLKAALDTFSKQSGVSLMVSADILKGARTEGVTGDLPANDALSRILRGTGFEIYHSPTGALGVMRKEQSSDAADALQPMRLAQAAPPRAAVETVTVTSSKLGGADVQSIPIAITALSQEQLTATQTAGGPDLVKQVPNLTFTKTNFTGYSIQIRGIGTQAISVTTDPAVAVAMNDTPFIRNHFFEQEFYDLGQVEVLRGPQGTLYGRNATAGVVNLTTAKPTDQFEAMASAEIGNYHQRRFEGMINLPIVDDRLDIRLAAEWTKRQGYSFNSLTDQRIDGRDLWSGRLTIGLKPIEGLQAYLVWEHFSENDDRMRTAKQLCKYAPTLLPDGSGNFVPRPRGVGGDFFDGASYLSQGCEQTSLYSPDAFQTPNGDALPYYFAPGNLGVPVNPAVDPYASADQSQNLRVIETALDPIYKVKNDIIELNVDYAITPAFTFTSQTSYNQDFLWSTEDYNRFNTSPGVFVYTGPAGSPGNERGLIHPDGSFCDPQLGCSNRLVAQDLSEEHAWQLGQEFRLSSNFSGPFNFSIGGNYLHYETEESYYVFFNSLSLTALGIARLQDLGPAATPYVPGVSDNRTCLGLGRVYGDPTQNTGPRGCNYVDPNPLTDLNNNGHNYFLSQNPYLLDSYATFGEANYNVTKDFKLIAGLRWTEDRKHFTLIPSELLIPDTWGYPAMGVVDQQWDQFTGRIVGNWTPKLNFTDQTLVYGSYAHGYKAGGANPPGAILGAMGGGDIAVPVHPLTFKPEFVDAFEIGTKNQMLDGALTLNANIFYYNYENYQISQIVDRTSINLNFDAHIKGAEIEATYEPLPGLRFNFAGGYENTSIAKGSQAIDLMDRTGGHSDWIVVKPSVTQSSNCILPKSVVEEAFRIYSGILGGSCSAAYGLNQDIITRQSYQENPTTNYHGDPITDGYPGFNPATAPNGGEGFAKDLSGNELPNAPPFTVSAGAQYTLPLSSDWAGTLRADYYWQDYSWARVFNDNPYDRLRGYTNVNFALILTSQGGWQVMLYDKNVFNTTAITGTFLNSDDSGLTTNVFLTDPKLIGIRVTKNW